MSSAPLSLYLDLEDGQRADLQVVSRAAIAWANAIDEIAYVIDPSIELKIDFHSGTRGSLSLNTIIRSTSLNESDRRAIRTAVVSAAMWFTLEGSSWTVGRVLDWMTSEDAPAVVHELSRDEIEEIADTVVRKMQNVAQNEVEAVYGEVEQDAAIKGVGVTTVSGKRPTRIIPRSEFKQRAGKAATQEHQTTHRTTVQTVEVVLVSPVLDPGSPKRRWKLASHTGEFGAVIDDKKFLEDVWLGRTVVAMVAGITMLIDLEVTEEKIDGAWRPSAYKVLNVHKLSPPTEQAQLFPTPGLKPQAPSKDNQPGNK
ncbi:MAG: hypothetical protein AAF608_11010 [Pseudomonadota bacterium]